MKVQAKDVREGDLVWIPEGGPTVQTRWNEAIAVHTPYRDEIEIDFGDVMLICYRDQEVSIRRLA